MDILVTDTVYLLTFIIYHKYVYLYYIYGPVLGGVSGYMYF